MAKRRKVGNLLALSLLSLLAQKPMYPYEMAQTLRARGKEQNFKINWGSLYTVVQNLEKYGFIEAAATEREGRQPERTTYQITDPGLAELRDWLERAAQRAGGRARRVRHGAVRGGHPAPRRGDRPAHQRAGDPRQGQRQPAGGPEALGRAAPAGAAHRGRIPARHAHRPGGWLRGLLVELVAGTISGMDGWRHLHETGKPSPEFEELDELAKRGWTENPEQT